MPVLLGLGSAATPVDLSIRVAANDDSASAVVFSTFRSNIDPLYWFSKAGNAMNTNLRFTNLTIPQGATIQTAKLTVYSRGYRYGMDSHVYVMVGTDQADDSSQITSYSAHQSRKSNVNTEIKWLASSTDVGDAMQSPELKTIVQEVVSRPGWSSGNAIQFFCEASTEGSATLNLNLDYQSYADNSGPEYIPLLEVTYTP